MRHILIAAAIATCGFLAISAANAVTFEAGGPKKIGNMCRVSTDFNSDMDAFGYYEPCAPQGRTR